MRRTALLAILAVSLAACSDAATTPDPTAAPTTAAPAATTTTVAPTTAPSTTEAPAGTDATTTTVRERPEGEAAPDFTLALGGGGEFTLSDEQKPVYMVFWAEW